jgi:oligopeptide transport system substrate-binding protein
VSGVGNRDAPLIKRGMAAFRTPIAILLALVASGCDRRSDDAPITVSVAGGEAELRDPAGGAMDEPDRVLTAATAQGLVRFDAAGGIEPGLAERWIVTDGSRSYIFRLREAEWSDGEPVTAREVVESLRRSVAARSRSALAPFVAVIDEIVEMTPQVIEIRLTHPRPDLLKLFAQPELAIVRRANRAGSGPIPRGGRPARLDRTSP